MNLDTLYTVRTPEVTDINLRPAGVVSRARAFVVDFIIRVLLVIAVSWALLSIMFVTGDIGRKVVEGIWFIFVFIIYWLYPVLFETFWKGQTPGKKLLRLRVVQDNGSPITFSASLIRNLLRVVDVLPFSYAGGMVCMFLNPQFKRCGDIVSGSMVVYVVQSQYKVDRRILANVTAINPPITLSKNERVAIMLFVERLPRLPPERAQELANHLLEGTSIPEIQRIDTIKSWAKSMLGERRRWQS
ncbi:MAG: RDD family protein [Neisseriaceae bacterium]|nr:RDD family protein [Neisseriaceae bacterium]